MRQALVEGVLAHVRAAHSAFYYSYNVDVLTPAGTAAVELHLGDCTTWFRLDVDHGTGDLILSQAEPAPAGLLPQFAERARLKLPSNRESWAQMIAKSLTANDGC